jgi:hypothetical protein
LDGIDLSLVAVVFTLSVALHNAAEFVSLPGWMARHGSALPLASGASALRFRFAASMVTLLVFGALALALEGGPGSPGAYVLSGVVIAMAVNAIVPHLVVSVATGALMPGTLSGLLLVLPSGIAFLVEAVRSGFVILPRLAVEGPFIALLFALVTWLLVSATFWRQRRRGFDLRRR